MFNLAAVHDVNTGIILTTLTIACLKNRSTEGLAALVIFVLSILPTPLHGTGIWGIAALLSSYFFLYRTGAGNREVSLLIITAIVFMMFNIALGLKLRGVF